MYLSLKELGKRFSTNILIKSQPLFKDKEKSFVRLLEEKALLRFISKRDVRLDFQKFSFRGITVILVNISRAVLKESQEFYRFLLTAIEEGANKFIIDLTSVEHIDTSFAGVLVAVIRKLNHMNGNMKLVMDISKMESNPILLNGLNKVFEVYPTVKDGLKSFNINLVLV